MLCVFDANATDFTTHGLGLVEPTSCTVTETLNGEWELALVHPIDENGKWLRLQYGNIIKAPVPAAPTPRVNLISQADGTVIYRVVTEVHPLNLRSGTGTSYKILGTYKAGTEVVIIARTTSEWYEVLCPDGRRGYMSTQYLEYVRTVGSTAQATGQVIESRQLREQPFRIYRVVPELNQIAVYARHIFYDLMDNMIVQYKPNAGVSGVNVVNSIFQRCQSPHSFSIYTDLAGTADDLSFENVNPIEALLGEGGVTETFKGELARDWYDVYLVNRVGSDSDVQVRQGKNLLGVSYDVDETNVATRLLPTGEDENGELLYLDELYIDSPNLYIYPHPKWMHLHVRDAKVSDDMTIHQAKTKMREAVYKELENGCDMPSITLTVDFVNVGDTEEYDQYVPLTDIFLGDSVRIVSPKLGLEVSLRMTQYTYDCLLRRYTNVKLGAISDSIEGSLISARQIASGSITGGKLAIGSVGSGQLQSASVGSLQVKAAAIGAAHIQEASITRAHIAEALVETLTVNTLTAVSAKIEELVAGSITTDEMYAAIASIALAQINTANIIEANIGWANIESLAAEIATITKANITTANIQQANIDWAAITTLTAATAEIVKASIGTADVDWAHIKDMVTDTAIITQGVAGELYIARLAVTEANMVSLTVGELVVKGTDGNFYAVSVDEDGQVVTTVKQVTGDNIANTTINAGEKIIEGTVTAATLNVQDIFANSAIIRSLMAANIDVDTLFAREATITALNAMDITSNTYLRLMVDGKADQADMDQLAERVSKAELKITEDAIVSTVTSSTAYRDDRERIYTDMDALLGYRVEIRADTVFLTEAIRHTTLTARVWHGNEDVTDTLDAACFIWTRESGDAMADAVWNDSHRGLKSVLVSTADVLRQASFRCDLYT